MRIEVDVDITMLTEAWRLATDMRHDPETEQDPRLDRVQVLLTRILHQCSADLISIALMQLYGSDVTIVELIEAAEIIRRKKFPDADPAQFDGDKVVRLHTRKKTRGSARLSAEVAEEVTGLFEKSDNTDFSRHSTDEEENVTEAEEQRRDEEKYGSDHPSSDNGGDCA